MIDFGHFDVLGNLQVIGIMRPGIGPCLAVAWVICNQQGSRRKRRLDIKRA
jgi:hypothetical protein